MAARPNTSEADVDIGTDQRVGVDLLERIAICLTCLALEGSRTGDTSCTNLIADPSNARRVVTLRP